MREAFKQKSVGCSLVAGSVMIVCGLGGSWVFSVAGVYRGTYTRTPGSNQITDAGAMNYVPLMILLIAVGVVLVLGALTYSFILISTERSGPQRTIDNVKVIARYAINRNGDMLSEWYQIEEAYDTVRYYVRLAIPNKENLEFECSEQVFHACGEGMYGRAVIQNKWLGQFIGYVGAPQPPPPDPFAP